jgi:hypothetical protein
MTPEQAIQFLKEACALIVANKNVHDQVGFALAVLDEALKPKAE